MQTPKTTEKPRKIRNAKPDGMTPIAEAAWAEERLLKIDLAGSLKLEAVRKDTAAKREALLASLTAEARQKLGK